MNKVKTTPTGSRWAGRRRRRSQPRTSSARCRLFPQKPWGQVPGQLQTLPPQAPSARALPSLENKDKHLITGAHHNTTNLRSRNHRQDASHLHLLGPQGGTGSRRKPDYWNSPLGRTAHPGEKRTGWMSKGLQAEIWCQMFRELSLIEQSIY